ncbi:MAG: M48 family metallopeptidase [Burkholderiales bacterium]|nr:M48 family metallopeptidase [Burkholderiales bacterium]
MARARSQPESRQLYRIGGRDIPVLLRRSARRSVGLLIRPEGLTVTLPNRFPLHQLDGVLRDKAAWIIDKLDQVAQLPRAAQLMDGAEVPWLGEPRVLRIGQTRGAVTGDELRLTAHDAAGIPVALTKLMRREARSFLAERLAQWASRMQLRYSEFKLSSAGTRWGSCSSAGVIRLNWRLMQAPLPVIDYVIIHELCHLVELNHSARFWALVAAVCPDWKVKRDWLKQHGGQYFAW